MCCMMWRMVQQAPSTEGLEGSQRTWETPNTKYFYIVERQYQLGNLYSNTMRKCRPCHTPDLLRAISGQGFLSASWTFTMHPFGPLTLPIISYPLAETSGETATRLTVHNENSLFRIDLQHFEVLGRYLLIPHISGHLLPRIHS
jgi:hypothetical protein